jgi:hypothetical protein
VKGQQRACTGIAGERLALLTTHVSRAVRQQSYHTQLGLIRARPMYRNAVLVEMCLLLQKLPWNGEGHQSIVEQILLLIRHWLACLQRERGLTEGERCEGEGVEPLDVALIEGFGILTLCSPIARLRKLGLQLLGAVRDLHMCALLAFFVSCSLHEPCPASQRRTAVDIFS